MFLGRVGCDGCVRTRYFPLRQGIVIRDVRHSGRLARSTLRRALLRHRVQGDVDRSRLGGVRASGREREYSVASRCHLLERQGGCPPDRAPPTVLTGCRETGRNKRRLHGNMVFVVLALCILVIFS